MNRISRRKFLKDTGAAATAAALPYIVPGPTLGKEGASAANERITMGAIGLGGQGVRDMRNFMSAADVQFLAVCDVEAEKRNAAKAIVDSQYGNKGCTAYNDFRDLLARNDIDAVLIATGDRWHSLLSILAANAGKDIYCEKPMSLTVAEGRAVADAVKRYNVVYQCGTQRRSMRTFSFAVKLARTGKLGELHTLRSYVRAGQSCPVHTQEPVPPGFNYDLWLGPAPFIEYSSRFVRGDWKNHFDYSGGMITDWGAHCNDLAQWANDADLTGPTEYEGSAEFPSQGFCNVATKLHLVATYANSPRRVKLVMHQTKEMPLWPTDNTELAVKFEGADGWVYADDGGNMFAEPKSLLQDMKFEKQQWTDAANWQGHHRNFLDCVKTRAQTIAPAEIAHRSTTTCHVANICLRLARKLTWNPQTERFVNDAEADKMLSRTMRRPWHL
jgi:predicted dehydrogenase